LELALATARSSVAAQEQIVATVLEHFSATAPGPDLTVKNPNEAVKISTKREEKNPTETRS
ncbi:MAG: integrase, partial [Hydrogenophaga sp.]